MNNSIKRETISVHEALSNHIHIPAPQPPPLRPQSEVVNKVVENDNENTVASFFWTVIDDNKFPNLSIPYILKKNDVKYLSVRIIERTILTKYENNYSDEVKRFGSLNSELCTPSDVVLLNEINDYHVNKEYGNEPFTLQDTLVQLEDFLRFYEILSRTCKIKDLARPSSIKNMSTENSFRKVPLRPLTTVTPQQTQQKQTQQSQLNIPDFVFNSNITNNNIINNTQQTLNMNSNIITTTALNQTQQRALHSDNLLRNDRNENHAYTLHQKQLQQNLAQELSNSSHQQQQYSNNLLNRTNIEQNINMLHKLTPNRTGLTQLQQHSYQPRHSSPSSIQQQHNSTSFNHPIHHNNNHNQFISTIIQHQSQLNPNIEISKRNVSPSNSTNQNMMQRIQNHQSSFTNPHLTNNLNNNSSTHKTISPRLAIEQQINSRSAQDNHNHLGLRPPINLSSIKSSSPLLMMSQPPLLPPPFPIHNLNPHQLEKGEIFNNNNSIDRSSNSSSPYQHNERYLSKTGNIAASTMSSQLVPSLMSIGNNLASSSLSQSPLPPAHNCTSPNFLTNCQPLLSNNNRLQQPLQKQIYQQQATKTMHNNQHIIQALSAGNFSNPPNRQANFSNSQSSTSQTTSQNQHNNRMTQSMVHSIPLQANNINNQSSVYSNTNNSINASQQQMLNSPTPPLTPTPSNLLLSNLHAISPFSSSSQQQPAQFNRQAQANLYFNATNLSELVSSTQEKRSLRNSIESNNVNPTQNIAGKLRKQLSTSSLNSYMNEPDNDCIILDEQQDVQEIPTQRRVSASTNRSYADLGVSITENNAGLIQLNDIIVPYIRLPSRTYRCCSQYQPSNTYIPCKLLSTIGLIPRDEISLKNKFETIHTIDKKNNPNEYNKINDLFGAVNLQCLLENEIVLVNLLDLFSHCREALFLKQHKLGKQIISNYKEVLAMTGGVVLLDIIDGPRDLLIFPFVNYSSMVLAPYNTFNNYVRYFNPTKVDYSTESLNNEIFTGPNQDIPIIRQFLNLLLFYLTDNERKCKLPTTIRLINIKPWLTRYPDEFKILCRFTSNFPSDWVHDIEYCLIKFKLATKALNSNPETTTLANEPPTLQQAATTVIQTESANQIETISLSPSSMDSVTPSVSPFSSTTPSTSTNTTITNQTQCNIKINEKLPNQIRIINAGSVDTLSSAVPNETVVETKQTLNSNISNSLNTEFPYFLEQKNHAGIKAAYEEHEKIFNTYYSETTLNNEEINIEIVFEAENLKNELKVLPTYEQSNFLKNQENFQEPINDSMPKNFISDSIVNKENGITNDAVTEFSDIILDQINENSIETSNSKSNDLVKEISDLIKDAKNIDFDYDDGDNLSSYDVFKLKRRLSDSVLYCDIHTALYKRYLDDEKSLVEEGKFDKKLNEKLNKISNNLFISNNISIEKEKRVISVKVTAETFKNEPSSPLINKEFEINDNKTKECNNYNELNLIQISDQNKQCDRISKRINSSSSSSSSISKRTKYSKLSNKNLISNVSDYDCFNDDGLETISDSDSRCSEEPEIIIQNESIPKFSIDNNKNGIYSDEKNNVSKNIDENDKSCLSKPTLRTNARKSTTYKPSQNWVNDRDLYTTEEFDENYYLKKFNIQDCCVVLENVGNEKCFPKKQCMPSLSDINDDYKNIKIADLNDKTNPFTILKSSIRITSSISLAESNLKSSQIITTASNNNNTSNNSSTNFCSLLQPLSCNQNNIKYNFNNNLTIKHKENKHISK